MPLIESFEKSGNFLFKNRGQIPVVLFIAAVPVIYFTGYGSLNSTTQLIVNWISYALSITGFIVRSISIATTPKGTSGRNTEQQVAESLNTTGIYSLLRHPLYLGNFLMWSGIVLFTYNFWFFVVFCLAFWLYYERIMFAEERFLEQEFGDHYTDWARTVPAFIPSFSNYKERDFAFSIRSILRREYSGVLATVTGFTFVDQLRYLFIQQQFGFNRLSTYIFLGTLLITLALRTIKHNTNWISEESRS